jgi:hypothetical protein
MSAIDAEAGATSSLMRKKCVKRKKEESSTKNLLDVSMYRTVYTLVKWGRLGIFNLNHVWGR